MKNIKEHRRKTGYEKIVAIIGAESIVSKNILPHEIFGGGLVAKYRFILAARKNWSNMI